MDKIVQLFYELGIKRKNDPNCYRYDLFKDRDPLDSNSPQYTWQWNFTKEEYQQIKNLLKNYSGNIQDIIKKSKISCKMLQLYVSEWYKREFNGYDGQGNAFAAINMENIAYEIWCGLFHNPDNKVYYSNIDEYGNETGRRRWLESIYVDGGLPLHYLLNKDNTAFRKTIKDIIESNNEGIEYSSNDLGVLCGNEVVNQSYRGRILHPDEDEASIFDFIQETIINENLVIDGFEGFVHEIRGVKKKAEIERTHRNPFIFKWLFDFDDPYKTISVSFEVRGPSTLTTEFVDEHNLRNFDSINVALICNNNKIITRFEKLDDSYYCRREIKWNRTCEIGDMISVAIEETGDVLLSRELDLSDPKLLSLIDEYNNTYTLCDSRKIAVSECRVIAESGWGGENVGNECYSIGEETYKVFFLPRTTNVIRITNESAYKTFDPQIPLFWTTIDPDCSLVTQVPTKESLYNVKEMNFFKGVGDRIIQDDQTVLFAAKGSRQWNRTPRLGVIRARIDMGDESVDPVKFINVGELKILKESSSHNTFDVRIEWNGGMVASNEAQLQNGIWHISKSQLTDFRYVPFVFTPSQGNGEPFVIHICPSFEDFVILDSNNNEVEPNSIIPMVNLNTFRYYLYGNNLKIILGGNREEQLIYRYNDDRIISVSLHRLTNQEQRELREIQCEGWLSNFFGGENAIRNLLERSTLPIEDAIDKISVYKNFDTIRVYNNFDNNPNIYYFKDFPYKVSLVDDNCLSIEQNIPISENQTISLPAYNGSLLSIPLCNPSANPINIPPPFVIPEEMLDSQHNVWLVYGDKQGLIYPEIIFLNAINEERNLLDTSIIKYELRNAELFNEMWRNVVKWFELIHKGRIPASSMPMMVAIAEDPDLLVKLALHLYIKNYDENEDTKNHLLEFQRQMSFLWSWVPFEDLTDYINLEVPEMMLYYKDWKSNQGDYIEVHRTNTADDCIRVFMSEFKDWFEGLRIDPTPIYTNPEINALGDGLRSREARVFFSRINVGRNNLTPRERWILERICVHEYIKQGRLNAWNFGESHPILAVSSEATKEIHRSIIYGLKFSYYEI